MKLKTLLKQYMPILDLLDDVTYRMIAIGWPLLTGGIITGAVWANSAWGTYWSWDPKETWSLITWFVYAIYLHARYVRGWKGTQMAVISAVGFLAVIFTYLGVNLVLSGLHSYGGMNWEETLSLQHDFSVIRPLFQHACCDTAFILIRCL